MGIVHVQGGVITDNFSFICQPPGNNYERQNIAIHRIFPSQTENEPTIEAYYDKIFHMLNRSRVVAHNAAFDSGVLCRSLEKYDLKPPRIRDWHCTYKLTNNSLDVACEIYGVELTDHHDPLSDAIACANIYLKLAELSKRSPAEKKKDQDRQVKLRIDALLAEVEFPKENSFAGKRVVLTGLFHHFEERELLHEILTRCGALTPSSISKKTDVVICGELPGPAKMNEVNTLNKSGEACIKVINESQMIEIFNDNKIQYQF